MLCGHFSMFLFYYKTCCGLELLMIPEIILKFHSLNLELRLCSWVCEHRNLTAVVLLVR